MPYIQLDVDKAARVVAQVLRDEHNMLPEPAIALAHKIVRRLQSSPTLVPNK
jgi:hypothetical protein